MKVLQKMGLLDHVTCLPRNQHSGQEATVRQDMEQQIGSELGKEYIKTILSPSLFNLHVEFIIQNSRLDKRGFRIKVFGRNINNLRYTDRTIHTADHGGGKIKKGILKRLLRKVKEESENGDLRLSIQNENHGIQPHHFMANRWGKKMEMVRNFILGGLHNHCRW